MPPLSGELATNPPLTGELAAMPPLTAVGLAVLLMVPLLMAAMTAVGPPLTAVGLAALTTLATWVLL